MATTLRIRSFDPTNLRERSTLEAATVAGADSLEVASTEGFSGGQVVYVGTLAREQCERAVIASVEDAAHLALTTPLKFGHQQFDALTAVLGDSIRIYRAADVDGSIPTDDQFSVLATRSINPDAQHTYYTDSDGSSAHWYRWTYYNAATSQETPLSASQAVRGDDFAHYAHLDEIRSQAGFRDARNLNDADIDRQRRIAESEVNTALGSTFTVPFVKPIPERVHSVTLQLAAGLLKNWAYPTTKPGQTDVDAARSALAALAAGEGAIDNEGNSSDSGISGYPDNDSDRMFTVGQVF